MTTTIIGAGPVGCFLGKRLSKKGVPVTIVEEHERAGEPLQCSGLVSGNILDIVGIPEHLIVNHINTAKFFFGDKKIEFKGKALVIDRAGFDEHMYEQAEQSGVKFHFNEQYVDYSYSNNRIMANTNLRKIDSDFLVGADGPGSQVGKQIGVRNEVLPGLQVRAKGEFEPGSVELHFGEYAPEFFAWVVPESDKVARIGLATRRDITEMLKKFLKDRGIKTFIDKQAGLIPIGYHEDFVADRVALVGDAASQTKATTGGGLTTGLASAKLLSRALLRGFEANDFSMEFLETHYVDAWKKGIGSELRKAYAIRKVMDTFTAKDYGAFFDVLKNENFKHKLEENADMEMYSNFLKKSIMTPAALMFGIKLFFKHPELLKYLATLL
ncbi:MAG: NAD(P)/FAD-dependent oxidoreductase [Candidatus Nanoarchaeia archaeon]|nr:NAD(P)/FAD-dependent oxidoreductase [Candidatus Nanoarchaeia archaeon]MDD5239503.1 NAD(P)/FAD-dependent oxidoreductase [Candidatus Nanoarchaeia archaeon]